MLFKCVPQDLNKNKKTGRYTHLPVFSNIIFLFALVLSGLFV